MTGVIRPNAAAGPAGAGAHVGPVHGPAAPVQIPLPGGGQVLHTAFDDKRDPADTPTPATG